MLHNFSSVGNFSQHLKFDARLNTTVDWQVQVVLWLNTIIIVSSSENSNSYQPAKLTACKKEIELLPPTSRKLKNKAFRAQTKTSFKQISFVTYLGYEDFRETVAVFFCNLVGIGPSPTIFIPLLKETIHRPFTTERNQENISVILVR